MVMAFKKIFFGCVLLIDKIAKKGGNIEADKHQGWQGAECIEEF